MKVKKSDGRLEDLDFSKPRAHLIRATEGLNASYSDLETEAIVQFYDGISTSDIQKLYIKSAVERTDIDSPDWTYVAARLFLYSIYSEVKVSNGSTSLRDYLEKGIREERLFHNLGDGYDLGILQDAIDESRDLQFTYLGLRTMYDRYLIKGRDGKTIETPQNMFMGIAMFLARGEEDKMKWCLAFYGLLSKFEVMAATPTLSNARTPSGQCSSCYIGSTPDSAEGIVSAFKEMVLLSKFGGGIGWDWTGIRPARSYIDGHKGVSGGVIPMLKITNDISLAFDQLGTRKGAIAVYMEPWHMDILDFLDIKKNSGEERRRAHDLFPAVWLNDVFMERVREDKPWTLLSSHEYPELIELHGEDFKERYEELEKVAEFKEVISAKGLWKIILKSYFETGSPFLTFKDEANRRNPNGHSGVIRSSNLCTEIYQNTEPSKTVALITLEDGTELKIPENEIVKTVSGRLTKPYRLTSEDSLAVDGNVRRVYSVEKTTIGGSTAVCNLASVNLSRVNTREDLERVIPIAVRMLDNVIDLNFHPVKKVKDTNLSTRSIGLGVMGEAQLLAENKILFGTKEHYEFIDRVMDDFSYFTINASADLASEKGSSYPEFEGSDWSKGILPIHTANVNAKKLTSGTSRNNWKELSDKVKGGIRNGYLMAIAPTSSISILVGTSQAIEPIYKRKWFEENLSGLIPVTAPNISPETWNYYPSAYEVKQTAIITAAAVRQKWIDQGQSLNVFVRQEETTGARLNKIYMLAHRLGLKSTYYLRSTSPEEQTAVQDRSQECVGCQ
jgi:ribonucleoside-diphosphate reductase alpha chain